ncbi:hypothetical protein [Phaeovulum sp.]|uniref:hypothetical protein n=1 Tax=Phaeovulum sp. TaxID=2934796 RepID=UPI003562362A
MAQRPWITALRLLLALVVLAGAILRPPGTMAERVGDTITYVICAGGVIDTIRVSASNGQEVPQGSNDAGCDFFAHQVAAAPVVAPVVLPLTNQHFSRLVVVAEAIFIASAAPRAHAPRGPPALI